MFLKLIVVLASICALTSAQILPPSGARVVRPGIVVRTPSGSYQGQEETYDIFRRIMTFKGIRFGQAPVGNLRFRQPLASPPLTQLQQAWKYGNQCPQFTLVTGRLVGDEDCLFLNIATPMRIRSRLPVLVLIHGGGLQLGSGQMDTLGPELIVNENVITVSANYRLNVLGFLNSGDRHSPGNYAIKDMILTLQWVRDNIESFGGNPNDITISGSSGGAVAVHALVVSQAAAGLFHKAVASSGSLFSAWAFQRKPENSVRRLAENLQLHYTNNENLLFQLRQVSMERLMRAAGGLNAQNPTFFTPLDFITSLDPVDSLETRIFTAPVEVLIRNGNINEVPFLAGYVSDENLFAINQVHNDPSILERFNQNPNLLVPPEWNITPNSPDAASVITAFRNLYFGGNQNITTDYALQWSHYATDRDFVFGMSKMVRLHRNRQSVYYYRFSYSGALNIAKRLFRLDLDMPGAVHGDDAFYIYRLNRFLLPISNTDEAFLIQRRCVRLWTNFFRFGNPTPTSMDPLLSGVTWPMLTANEEFLDINSTLINDVHPFKHRMEVWHALDKRFNP